METFVINLVGENYTVIPNENETFTVKQGEEVICTLYPEEDLDSGFSWTADKVSDDFAAQLGELIYEHYI